MVLSIGTWLSNHGWLILSKQDLMSPSSIHCGLVLFESTVAHCSIASAQLRSFRNPYEFGSASVSAMGSRACRYKACMALSCIVGIPSGLFVSLFGLGMYILRTGHGSKVSALSVVVSSSMYPSKFPRKFDMVFPSIPAVSLPAFCWT